MNTYNVITFNKGCDSEALDGLSWKFGADWSYTERKITYIGSPERFQELLRAVRTIEQVKDVRSYDNGKLINAPQGNDSSCSEPETEDSIIEPKTEE